MVERQSRIDHTQDFRSKIFAKRSRMAESSVVYPDPDLEFQVNPYPDLVPKMVAYQNSNVLVLMLE
jgi:hypothetical protein